MKTISPQSCGIFEFSIPLTKLSFLGKNVGQKTVNANQAIRGVGGKHIINAKYFGFIFCGNYFDGIAMDEIKWNLL